VLKINYQALDMAIYSFFLEKQKQTLRCGAVILMIFWIQVIFSGCEKKPGQSMTKLSFFPAVGKSRHLSHDEMVGKLYRGLYSDHARYKEKTIQKQRFKQSAILPLIQRLEEPFRWSIAGKSIEGRPIYQVEYGEGPVKVLLWSQMHGDEPTATMALMDLFNFLHANDEYNALRARLRESLTLVFIPMLNPDGAERFERRNALGVDLNRDALRLQSPESRILKGIRDQISADWGFNLHDQSRYYAAGLTPKTAAISFLAPAFNYEKDINHTRGKAMQLIAGMNMCLQEFIPGNVARYDDEFEPRAFGDNIQRWGTATILIEAGALPNDPEKQELRRLHFATLLFAFDAIAGGEFENFDRGAYDSIPFNKTTFHDLVIREALLEVSSQKFIVDIAFRAGEAGGGNSSISDMGDLSIFHGYAEVDAKGMKIASGKRYKTVLSDIEAVKRMNPMKLLQQGYTEVALAKMPDPMPKNFPLRLVKPNQSGPDTSVKVGRNPSFLLLQQNGKPVWAVVNGQAFNLE
jgi:hypothetical protein